MKVTAAFDTVSGLRF